MTLLSSELPLSVRDYSPISWCYWYLYGGKYGTGDPIT